jgi:hypothetical protein
VISALYTSVIDYMLCFEQEWYDYNQEPPYEVINLCAKDRETLAQAMINLISYPQSAGQTSTHLSCMQKTEMLEIETRYPPYDWMVDLIHKHPTAIDAKAFMECVKK